MGGCSSKDDVTAMANVPKPESATVIAVNIQPATSESTESPSPPPTQAVSNPAPESTPAMLVPPATPRPDPTRPRTAREVPPRSARREVKARPVITEEHSSQLSTALPSKTPPSHQVRLANAVDFDRKVAERKKAMSPHHRNSSMSPPAVALVAASESSTRAPSPNQALPRASVFTHVQLTGTLAPVSPASRLQHVRTGSDAWIN